jgi:hypothetical protein
VSCTASASVAIAAAIFGCLACSRFHPAAGAPGDQQRNRDSGPCQRRWQQRQQEIALAGEDARCQPDAEHDQRQRIDRGVEKAGVELALGDQLRRHPEPVQDQRSNADTPPRAAREK